MKHQSNNRNQFENHKQIQRRPQKSKARREYDEDSRGLKAQKSQQSNKMMKNVDRALRTNKHYLIEDDFDEIDVI